MQLDTLDLHGNLLVGTLPQSWSTLTSVGHCNQRVHLLPEDSESDAVVAAHAFLHRLVRIEPLCVCHISKAPIQAS